MSFQSFDSVCFNSELFFLYPLMFMVDRLALTFFASGVVVMCLVELSLELLLIVAIPLEEVLFIIGGNRC